MSYAKNSTNLEIFEFSVSSPSHFFHHCLSWSFWSLKKLLLLGIFSSSRDSFCHHLFWNYATMFGVGDTVFPANQRDWFLTKKSQKAVAKSDKLFFQVIKSNGNHATLHFLVTESILPSLKVTCRYEDFGPVLKEDYHIRLFRTQKMKRGNSDLTWVLLQLSKTFSVCVLVPFICLLCY